jgi:DnaJ-class molecular chaperone
MGYNWAKKKMKKIFLTMVLVVCSATLFAQQEVRCPKCQGSGKVRVTEERRCNDCNGTGTNIVYYIETCPNYTGTTKMKDVDKNGNLIEVPCNFPYCNKGKVRTPRTEKCGACGGTGVDKWSTETTCPRCYGSGKIRQ